VLVKNWILLFDSEASNEYTCKLDWAEYTRIKDETVGLITSILNKQLNVCVAVKSPIIVVK
jgi:hypothetical protein